MEVALVYGYLWVWFAGFFGLLSPYCSISSLKNVSFVKLFFIMLQFQANLKAFYYVPWEEFNVLGVPLFIPCDKDISKLLRKGNWAKLCSWCRICLLTFSWTPHLREFIFSVISEPVTILHMWFSKIPCSSIKTLCCLKTFIYVRSILDDLYIIWTRKHDVYQIRTTANLEIISENLDLVSGIPLAFSLFCHVKKVKKMQDWTF